MWKITNERNKKILDIFHRDIVLNLFAMMEEFTMAKEQRGTTISGVSDIWNSQVYQKLNPTTLQNAFQMLFNQVGPSDKNGLDSFFLKFQSLVTNTKSKKLTKLIAQYKDEYEQVNEFQNYNLKPQTIPYELKQIFRVHLYELCMNDRNIWMLLLNGKSFSRGEFHANFREENDDLSICPYCDIHESVSRDSLQVEHFLPRNSFPLLSMAPMNMFSACWKCNGKFVKGHKRREKITTPVKEEIGDAIRFKKALHGPVDISSKKPRKEIDNFLEILNLVERYNDPELLRTLNKRLERIHLDFTTVDRNPDTSLTKEYVDHELKKFEKTYSMALITRHLYEEYPPYKKL